MCVDDEDRSEVVVTVACEEAVSIEYGTFLSYPSTAGCSGHIRRHCKPLDLIARAIASFNLSLRVSRLEAQNASPRSRACASICIPRLGQHSKRQYAATWGNWVSKCRLGAPRAQDDARVVRARIRRGCAYGSGGGARTGAQLTGDRRRRGCLVPRSGAR
ncbi:hypothetical protein DENSPDRAFT_571140 [Dentipellis sp. KUC8613]|nr:hypothetical protein DENSPDRAFT_571140 [Dentipellis sp. KUC8613]